MHKLLKFDSRNSLLGHAETKVLTDTSKILSYQLMQIKAVHLTISKVVFMAEPVFIFFSTTYEVLNLSPPLVTKLSVPTLS